MQRQEEQRKKLEEEGNNAEKRRLTDGQKMIMDWCNQQGQIHYHCERNAAGEHLSTLNLHPSLNFNYPNSMIGDLKELERKECITLEEYDGYKRITII